MKGITAKDLLNDQKKRFRRLKQKEHDNSTTEDAKASFRRVPYMGMYLGGKTRTDGHGDQEGEGV